jgi:hypothetical protein
LSGWTTRARRTFHYCRGAADQIADTFRRFEDDRRAANDILPLKGKRAADILHERHACVRKSNDAQQRHYGFNGSRTHYLICL